jgi:hypothetical protein
MKSDPMVIRNLSISFSPLPSRYFSADQRV